MRVALLQYPIAWADKEANLRLAEERIAALAGKADVAVLPEMFATGFCTDHPELAETMDGDIIRRLQAAADQSGVAIVSSFICLPTMGQRLVNRGFMITPHSVYPNREELEGGSNLPSLQGGDGGRLFVQDKRHLYAHGGEDLNFLYNRIIGHCGLTPSVSNSRKVYWNAIQLFLGKDAMTAREQTDNRQKHNLSHMNSI